MTRTTLGLAASLSALLAAVLVTGCKKDEPPPPLPSAAPVAAPPAPLQLKPEDSGVKPMPVDSGIKKPKAGGGSAGGLGPCCKALQQNANSAPEPTRTYMIQAAAACQLLAGQGQGKGALAPVIAALRGAGMPASCK